MTSLGSHSTISLVAALIIYEVEISPHIPYLNQGSKRNNQAVCLEFPISWNRYGTHRHSNLIHYPESPMQRVEQFDISLMVWMGINA